jgi:hypothetical protein
MESELFTQADWILLLVSTIQLGLLSLQAYTAYKIFMNINKMQTLKCNFDPNRRKSKKPTTPSSGNLH